jgi:hypothetical protein
MRFIDPRYIAAPGTLDDAQQLELDCERAEGEGMWDRSEQYQAERQAWEREQQIIDERLGWEA